MLPSSLYERHTKFLWGQNVPSDNGTRDFYQYHLKAYIVNSLQFPVSSVLYLSQSWSRFTKTYLLARFFLIYKVSI